MDNASPTSYQIVVSADAGRWRWSVSREREMAAGHAANPLIAGGNARVAAAVISGLGRIARRRF